MPEIYILHYIIDSLHKNNFKKMNFCSNFIDNGRQQRLRYRMINWSSLHVHCVTPKDRKMICRPRCPKSRPVRLNGRRDWRE